MSGCRLLAAAARCLEECDPAAKVALTHETAARIDTGELRRDALGTHSPVAHPGRPARPVLVAPRELAQRGLDQAEGRAALVHALSLIHI